MDGFEYEAQYQRTQFDKATGNIIVAEEIEKPDGGEELFEAVDAGTGEQFMATKPWIGAVVEPQNRKNLNNLINSCR